MATPEPSGHTTGRPDHPNPEEAEENNHKYKFLKMIETLKEGIKNSLKNGGKDNLQIGRNQYISSRNPRKPWKKKQVKKTVQTAPDLKTEIEAIKKMQTEGILEMENLGKLTGTIDVSITNRMEERISGIENTIEKNRFVGQRKC